MMLRKEDKPPVKSPTPPEAAALWTKGAARKQGYIMSENAVGESEIRPCLSTPWEVISAKGIPTATTMILIPVSVEKALLRRSTSCGR